jgi:hypothetical protein
MIGGMVVELITAVQCTIYSIAYIYNSIVQVQKLYSYKILQQLYVIVCSKEHLTLISNIYMRFSIDAWFRHNNRSKKSAPWR